MLLCVSGNYGFRVYVLITTIIAGHCVIVCFR